MTTRRPPRKPISARRATSGPADTQDGRTWAPGHPTREKLIAIVGVMLDERPLSSILSDDVLAAAGISKGSLYHHFEDFQELLELALVRRFGASVDLRIAEGTAALARAQDKDEFLEAVGQIFARMQTPQFKAIRMTRVQLVAMSDGNERLQKLLGAEQQRLTDAMADVIRDAQRRGWMNPYFDAYTAAVFVQAFSIGRVLDDIAIRPMDGTKWHALVTKTLRQVLG